MNLNRSDINYIISKAVSIIKEGYGQDDILASKKRKENIYDIIKELNLINVEYIKGNKCFVGFCEREQKWYGVCMSKIYGFGVGSKMYKNDCGYKYTPVKSAKSIWDAKKMAEAFAREALDLERMEAIQIQ